MAMDRLRACYQTDCRFWINDDTAIPIRWYFCQPGAKRFPGYTRFSSGNFASLPWLWFGPGEVQEVPRPFVDGSPPPFDGTIAAGFDGQKFAGPAEVFAKGVYRFESVPVGNFADGYCSTCGPVPCQLYEFDLPTTTYITIISTLVYPGGHVNVVPGQVIEMTFNPFNGRWENDHLYLTQNPGESFSLQMYCFNGRWTLLTLTDHVSNREQYPPLDVFFEAANVGEFTGYNPLLYEFWQFRWHV